MRSAVPLPASARRRAPCGLFRSTDRGRTWSVADRGIPSGTRVNAFGSWDGTHFAATDSGVFVSRDDARNWRPAAGAATPSGRVAGLARLERTIFAATVRNGILVSADSGKTWAASPGAPSRNVRCLLAHRGCLYAGTDTDGVFVSRDRGATWIPLRTGFPVHAQVFAGLYAKGLFAWDEPQRRWVRTGSVRPLVLASTAGTLVAGHNPGGLYWSANRGGSWTKGIAAARTTRQDAYGDLPPEAAVWDMGADDTMVFAGAAAGIYYSEDHGRTWTQARRGLPETSPGIAFLVERSVVLAAIPAEEAHAAPDDFPNGILPTFLQEMRSNP